MPTDALAAKLARYARLHRYTGPGSSGHGDTPLWTIRYPVFPAVLVVLTGRRRERLEQRRRTVLALCAEDTDLERAPAVQIAVGLLDDLRENGPFAPIFRGPRHRSEDADWLGTTR